MLKRALSIKIMDNDHNKGHKGQRKGQCCGYLRDRFQGLGASELGNRQRLAKC